MKDQKNLLNDLADGKFDIKLPEINLDKENRKAAKIFSQDRKEYEANQKMIDANVIPGDVIFVKRTLYRHFAVYVGDGIVIHYAPKSGKLFGDEEATIHEADISEFLDGKNEFFVCNFPDTYGKRLEEKVNIPSFLSGTGVIQNPINYDDVINFFRSLKYHLYSPEETIKRAKSRLGENKYSLIWNNCEHFAIWCKTGLEESKQVDEVLGIVSGRSSPIPFVY